VTAAPGLTTASTPSPRRGRFEGVLQIVRYNWTMYAAAFAILAVGLVLLTTVRWPESVRWTVAGGLALLAWWTLGSLAVSHWVYDRSALYRWTWAPRAVGRRAGASLRWMNVHAGLDESTPGLRATLGSDPLAVVDLFDPRVMTEPSVVRARARQAKQGGAWPGTLHGLAALESVEPKLDAVFLVLAAHEFRRHEERTALLRACAERLAPGGRVVLAEHQRDSANIIAFGPGAWHFHSRRTWLRATRAAGLTCLDEYRVTPFVRVFVLARP
jgi:SAM-dependent methyltransferase